MFRSLTITLCLTLASPALAQMDHATMNHGEDHDHSQSMSEPQAGQTLLTLATEPELDEALKQGGEPIVASVLGAVCDFCAMAMNKTFGKRDEVSAVYVDLDAKTLNLVLKPGATLSDEMIRKTVKKSGYQVSDIVRGPSLVTD